MKKIILLIAICFLGTMAESQILTFKPTTGDPELDGVLKDVDARAKKDINAFNTTVASNFNIAKVKVEEAIRILSPGDVFMAAQMALTLHKPFEVVVETYKTNKQKGWGAIAKEMGIKPGSPEFHEMKKALKSKGGNGPKANPGNANSKGNGKSKENNGHGKGKK